MTTVTLEEAQAKLAELIDTLPPGDELLITRDNRPVAQLKTLSRPQARFGSCKGMLTIVADDDEHLEDFKEYMP